MFAVVFEVQPRPERWDDYLGLAAGLRPELERIDGFLDNRRFRSRRRPGWLLSLSLWRDEKALVRWRAHAGHHAVQAKGRAAVFADYHLRVGEVIAENGVALPARRLDETETGTARALTLLERPASDPPPQAAGLVTKGLVSWDAFDGITDPGATLLLLAWRDRAALDAWTGAAAARRLDVRVVRDYGMTDRGEAPQHHA